MLIYFSEEQKVDTITDAIKNVIKKSRAADGKYWSYFKQTKSHGDWWQLFSRLQTSSLSLKKQSRKWKTETRFNQKLCFAKDIRLLFTLECEDNNMIHIS